MKSVITRAILIVCLVASLMMVLLLPVEAINDDSLALYLSFDDGAGDTAADQSGNSNTASFNEGVDWTVDSRIGGAVSFDGATGYILAGDAGFTTLGEPGDSYTVEAWIMTDQPGGVTWGAPVIAEKRRQPEWQRAFVLYINASNSLGVRFETGDASLTVDAKSVAINDGSWHHIAVTRNGAEAEIYIDGSLAEVGDIGDEERSSPEQPISLGCRRANDGTPKDYFAGILDEFAVYSRALTEAEIWQDMEDGVMAAVEPSGKLATTWAGVKYH